MANIIVCKILRYAALLLIIYTVYIGLSTVFEPLSGFADFPCMLHYNISDRCLEPSPWAGEQVTASTRVDAFLSTAMLGWGGGGCHHQASDDNQLELQTSFINLKLERVDQSVKVNELITVNPGSEFGLVNPFDLNPWVISWVDFKNVGVVADCETAPSYSRLVIMGSYGTGFSVVKGVVVCVLLIAILIYTQRRLKALKIYAQNGIVIETTGITNDKAA